MQRIFLGLVVLIALVVAPASASADPELPAGFSTMALAEGLDFPTAIAHAPDGRLFVAEKPGRLRVVSAEGHLRAAPVLDFSGHVATYGDQGLLGLALDTDFETNGLVYLLYNFEADPAHPLASKTARLTRIRVLPDNSVENPGDPETVLLGADASVPCPAPLNTVDCFPSESGTHTIGTVRSDSDGTLWVGSGDGADFNGVDTRALRTFDERSLSGKILHVDREGRGLPEHAYCPGRPTSTSSARSSTPRAFAIRSASSCARTGLRWSATSAGTRMRSSTWRRRDGAMAGPAGKGPRRPRATATSMPARPSTGSPTSGRRTRIRTTGWERRCTRARSTAPRCIPLSIGARGSSGTTPGAS